MKKIFCIILTIFFQHLIINAGETPALIIQHATKPVEPDGVVDMNDPWTTQWVSITANSAANTTSANTAKFQMTFNDTYLWLVVEVDGDASVDTSSVDVPLVTETDGVDVFLKMDTTSGDGSYREGDYHLRMKRGSVYPDGFNDFTPSNKLPIDSTFKLGQVDASSTYVQEWQFSWIALKASMKDSGIFSPAGTVGYFKFDVMVSDNTTGKAGGLTQHLFWHYPSTEQWHNTKYWGLIRLLDVKFCGCDPPKTVKLIKDTFTMVSPNPVHDVLSITSETGVTTQVKIYDVNGSLKMEQTIQTSEAKIDVRNLTNGIYFVKVINNSASVFKIVKE